MSTVTLLESRAIVSDAIKQVTTIATLPEITARIVATVEDPKSTASQLHKIVTHDPALATRILKVVNSSFYGMPGQIGSVERAIVLLGLNGVRNIALAASLGQLFRGVKLGARFTARDLWKHCIVVAVGARELARQMKLPITDEAFLAGLIHDVGVLVSLHVWPEKLREVCTRAAGSDDEHFSDIEREEYGVDHQQLGMGLAEQWKFTRSCQLVAGHHHQPTKLADNTRLLVTLVYVADVLACHSRRGFDLTARLQEIDPVAIGDIDLSMGLIERTWANIDVVLEPAMAILA